MGDVEDDQGCQEGPARSDAEKSMAGQEVNERWTRDHVAPSRPGWIV